MARRLTSALALSAGAATLALAVPAMAAGPYTVSVGGSTTGTPAFSATASNITFTTPSVDMSCTGATASGTVKAGANATGAGIASITAAGFSGCVGPLGLPLTVQATTPWTLNATGTATAGSSDTVQGTITGVSAYVFQTGSPASCNFKVTGSVDGSFQEAGQKLNVTPPTAGAVLTISAVTGCYGLISNGDTAEYTASYAITSPAGAIGIS